MKYYILVLFALLVIILRVSLVNTETGYHISATQGYSCVTDFFRNTSERLLSWCQSESNICRLQSEKQRNYDLREGYACGNATRNVNNDRKNEDSQSKKNGHILIDRESENHTFIVEYGLGKHPVNPNFTRHYMWVILAIFMFFITEQSHDTLFQQRIKLNVNHKVPHIQQSVKSRFGRKIWKQVFQFRNHNRWSARSPNFIKLQAYPFTFNQIAHDIVNNGRSEEELMHYEWSRFRTFQHFPMSAPVSHMRLSQAGFYFTGPGDEVRCFSCGVTFRSWRAEENVFHVHRRISPSCSFILNQNANNVPIHIPEYYTDINQRFNDNTSIDSTSSSLSQDMPESFGQDSQNNNPSAGDTINASAINSDRCHNSTDGTSNGTVLKHPEFSSLLRREESFKGWSFSDVQNPKTLAKSGFFFSGVRDNVRCFCCGLELNEWKKDDIPLVEHARFSNTCAFLKTASSNGNSNASTEPLKKSGKDKVNPTKSGHCDSARFKRSSEAQSLLAENQALRRKMTCKGCNACDANTVFLPCGHMITCNNCAPPFNTCIICGDQVKATVRVYQS